MAVADGVDLVHQGVWTLQTHDGVILELMARQSIFISFGGNPVVILLLGREEAFPERDEPYGDRVVVVLANDVTKVAPGQEMTKPEALGPAPEQVLQGAVAQDQERLRPCR